MSTPLRSRRARCAASSASEGSACSAARAARLRLGDQSRCAPLQIIRLDAPCSRPRAATSLILMAAGPQTNTLGYTRRPGPTLAGIAQVDIVTLPKLTCFAKEALPTRSSATLGSVWVERGEQRTNKHKSLYGNENTNGLQGLRNAWVGGSSPSIGTGFPKTLSQSRGSGARERVSIGAPSAPSGVSRNGNGPRPQPGLLATSIAPVGAGASTSSPSCRRSG